MYFGAPSLGVPGGGSSGCSWDPEAPEQRHVFLLGLLNLEPGIMSLKLVLMIEFVPGWSQHSVVAVGVLEEVPVPVPDP